MDEHETLKIVEIGDYVWPRLEPALNRFAEAVRARFPKAAVAVGRDVFPNVILSGRVVVAIEVSATADEDVTISVECVRHRFCFPPGTPSGEMDKVIRQFLRSKSPKEVERVLLTGDLSGPNLVRIEGPEAWIGLKQHADQARREIDAWIGATKQFVLDSTDLVLAELARAERRLAASDRVDQ